MAKLRMIFDLDDTLYPEREFALCGFRAAAQWAKSTLDIDGLDADMARLLDAGHLGRLFGMVLEERLPGTHTPEHAAALLAAYRNAEAVLQLFADAEWALQHYGGLGPLGLITDGTHAMQMKKVRALALEPRFRHILYTDTLGEGRAFAKPHARSFEMMASFLPEPGYRFVYVGDNPTKDFVAPNALGWITVQVVRDGGIHDARRIVPGGEPQHQVRSLTELPQILGV